MPRDALLYYYYQHQHQQNHAAITNYVRMKGEYNRKKGENAKDSWNDTFCFYKRIENSVK